MAIEKKDLLTYYQTVRQTIQGFDTLITNILTTGGTVTVAILVAPMAIFKQEDIDWSISFAISIFAVLAALYVFTAIALYADLLRRAVSVGKVLENQIFEGENQEAKLTTHLDDNPMAGGRLGTPLYLFMALVLYLVIAAGSTYYLIRSEQTLLPWWLWPLALLTLFAFWWRFLRRNETFSIDWAEAWSMFKKVFTCSK